jgi:hypothetical protein
MAIVLFVLSVAGVVFWPYMAALSYMADNIVATLVFAAIGMWDCHTVFEALRGLDEV